jgi:hypothetical protein
MSDHGGTALLNAPRVGLARHDQVSPAEPADAATGKTEPDDMSAFRLTKSKRSRRTESAI